MPKLTLFTQSALDGSNEAASPENLINCYVEQAAGDARTRLTARSVLGEEIFGNIDDTLVRAMERVGDYIFVAANGTLYRVEIGGSTTTIGSIVDSENTTISGNTGLYVTVAAGGSYYVWDGTTLTSPSGGRFSGAGSVTQMDFDTIITQPDGREVEWTTNADPTTRNALYFRTKEGRPDKVLRAVPFGRELYIFGTESTEIWQNTGVTGASRYQRLTGGLLDQGIKAYKLVKGFDSGIFLIGNDNVAKIIRGTLFEPVSTPSVQTDIDESEPVRLDYYEDRGHKFLCIVFSDRPAWVYDMTTTLWHRRASGTEFGPWDCKGIVEAFGSFRLISETGAIKTMVRNNQDIIGGGSDFSNDFNDDFGGGTLGVLARRCVSKPLVMDGNKFSVQKLQFLSRVGETSLGREAAVMMRVSWDGGRTWSQPETMSLGDLGDYDQTAEFRALGRGEQFAVEFTVTDPADIQLYSDAYVEVR